MAKNKAHIFLGKNGKPSKYIYPGTVVIKTDIPPLDRKQQFSSIKAQLAQVTQAQAQLTKQANHYELESRLGI